jgi:hypothetical protein
MADGKGDDVVEREKAFKKWVRKNSQSAIWAGVSALDLHHDPGRAGKG